MQDVARSPRLVWVVVQLGALLMTVQRLDRRVDVEHPGPLQLASHAAHQTGTQPGRTGRRIDGLECAVYRVFADHPGNAKRLRGHRVAAHSVMGA